MTLQIKQFVPSSVCLKCDGCCRFQLADSHWRPKVGQYEISDQIDLTGHVKTVLEGGHHQCVYFNSSDNTCGVYNKRPFECALYPFILSKSSNGMELFVHLACPYVQDNETKENIREYGSYLKTFFSLPSTKDFLKQNSSLLHDYSQYALELKFLFNVEV